MDAAFHTDRVRGSELASGEDVDRVQRARFDALRQKIFGEMAYATAKWRLAWILPFNSIVLIVLVARGEPAWRAMVQGGALVATATLFAIQLTRPRMALIRVSMIASSMCFFATLAVTGGICSPLVVTVGPMLLGAGVAMNDPKWMKSAFFLWITSGFVVLALLSRSVVGELVQPLAPVGGWATAEYVSIALLSVAFVVVGTYKTGCTISRAYQQVALELAERREELCSETEDRTRALEGIAARLAHEVKNPLAAIKGLSVHMARNACDKKMAERLSIVASEADRLQAIVDGFLSFSRGLDDLKLGPTRPHELAREIALLLETRAADSGVSLEVHGGEDVKVNADGRKLRQALLNLVLNAIQASAAGKTVRIDIAQASKERVEIKVVDEGPGMTADVLERIRKPYFTTKEGGSGLGVAVSRGLIEQHGGQLNFDSAPGRGTTVTIELPKCSQFCQKSALPNPCKMMSAGAQSERSSVPNPTTAR